ncbi:MAG: hypothetical protein JWP01_1980 [Myxococcales bacterium]|nr:hypothetical protein [Myxococcales bacterium]
MTHPITIKLRHTVALFALAFAGCGDNLAGPSDGGDDPDSGDTDGPQADQVPMVTSNAPFGGALDVPLNVRLSATFDLEMALLTDATFTLKQGSTPVTGVVSNASDGLTVTFAPAANLAASTEYTATITNGAMSLAGTPLASNHVWTFTTGTTLDMTAPVVNSTIPTAAATGVPINSSVSATFSKQISPQSITATSFTVTQGATPVIGTLSTAGTIVRFTPAAPLAASTSYTATLTTGVTDLQGNALASPFTWMFMTGTIAAQGPAPVLLGAAGNFTVLAKTAISTVPASAVTGDIGVSPAAATFITGFDLVLDATTTFSTSTQVVGGGRVYAASYTAPTPTIMTTSVSNMEGAYTDAASRPNPNFLELGTGNIGGRTLAPGLYKWTSTVRIPENVTLSGGPNDVWIFQTTGDLTMAVGKRVILAGGAQAKNVFWQVAGKVTFAGTSHFEGILLCKTDVTLQTGSTMNGRILAQTQVALQKATVTRPAQ